MSEQKETDKLPSEEILFKLWLIINQYNLETALIEALYKLNIKTITDIKSLTTSKIFKLISSINWKKDIKNKENKDSNIENMKKLFVNKIDQVRGKSSNTFDLIQLVTTMNWDTDNKDDLKQQCLNNIEQLLQKQESTLKQKDNTISSLQQQVNNTRQQVKQNQTELKKMRSAMQEAQTALNKVSNRPGPPPPPNRQQIQPQWGQWRCGVCTYGNNNGSNCTMCGANRNSQFGYNFNAPSHNFQQQYQPNNGMNVNNYMQQSMSHNNQSIRYNNKPSMNMNMNMNMQQSMPPSMNMGSAAPMRNSSMPKSMVSNYNSAPRKSNDLNTIGFSVGGAKDVNSFRENINNNKMPKLNSITFEGIYYDYYFDTNSSEIGSNIDDNDEKKNEEKPIFYPSYCCAKTIIPNGLLMAKNIKKATKKTNDMIDDEDEFDKYNFNINSDKQFQYFLTVGMNSNIKQSDFSRKKLNLIIVLDISGSMGSKFNKKEKDSKMKVANECILSLLTHLNYNDRFGLVLFDHTTKTHLQFKEMKDFKLSDFESILKIKQSGATDFEKGYNAGTKMFDDAISSNTFSSDIKEYENRIIFATDASPNVGKTDPKSLLNLVAKTANRKDKNKRIYTTFVGIGLDFNANLIAEITKVRGANYFAVKSSADFYKKLYLEFSYFVSPMVFNLKLILQSEGGDVCIDKVYGSNNIDTKSGEIMKIDTLFPSPPSDSGEIKGGIVLIKLKQNKTKTRKFDDLYIECSFEDKFGKKYKNTQIVKFKQMKESKMMKDYFTNLGVRKGILLTRYVLLMKAWIKDNGSGKIKVNDKYKQIFKTFKSYFQAEMKYIKDDTLKQEIKILNKLMKVKK